MNLYLPTGIGSPLDWDWYAEAGSSYGAGRLYHGQDLGVVSQVAVDPAPPGFGSVQLSVGDLKSIYGSYSGTTVVRVVIAQFVSAAVESACPGFFTALRVRGRQSGGSTWVLGVHCAILSGTSIFPTMGGYGPYVTAAALTSLSVSPAGRMFATTGHSLVAVPPYGNFYDCAVAQPGDRVIAQVAISGRIGAGHPDSDSVEVEFGCGSGSFLGVSDTAQHDPYVTAYGGWSSSFSVIESFTYRRSFAPAHVSANVGEMLTPVLGGGLNQAAANTRPANS